MDLWLAERLGRANARCRLPGGRWHRHMRWWTYRVWLEAMFWRTGWRRWPGRE